MFTLHAKRRLRQRGFHEIDAELILVLGIPENAAGGATKYRLPRKMVRDLIQSLNRMRNGATAIVGDAGRLQTLYKDYAL